MQHGAYAGQYQAAAPGAPLKRREVEKKACCVSSSHRATVKRGRDDQERCRAPPAVPAAVATIRGPARSAHGPSRLRKMSGAEK